MDNHGQDLDFIQKYLKFENRKERNGEARVERVCGEMQSSTLFQT